MIKDVDENEDIYKITIEKQFGHNKNKIILLILMVILLIALIMLAKKSIEIISEHKVYEQYEAQVIVLQQQERDRQLQEEKEKERIRKERMPQLTQERKKQYGKHLSFRSQKSIFNF